MLYFLRHADAERHAVTDAARPLTEKGRQQAKAVGQFCHRHRIHPTSVLSSPLVRAVQTAKIVCEELGMEFVETPWLASGMRPERLLEELPELMAQDSILLVGHEPDFGMAISHLIGSSSSAVHVRKASLTCVSLTAPRFGAGTLEFALPPRFM